jgi:hypothetical protein|tara:strand:+ start:105 stop:692 length:588 start_codon:yes stop_codon:yes gene_type:complete
MTINVTPIPRMLDLAAPAFTLGTSNAAGSAATAVSSNSTLLAFDAVVPTTIAYSASAVAGSAVVAARRDHTHGMAAPSTLKTTVVSGSRTASAGSGDQAITGAGFLPTGVIMLSGVDTGTSIIWTGFGDDALGEVGAGIDSAGIFVESVRISAGIGGSNNNMEAVLKSLDSDGCTLTWTKSNSGVDLKWKILFLG